MSMMGGRNGQMDLVQQMLMEKQKNQTRPPPDQGIMGGLAGMVGQANPAAGIGLSMLDKGGKALSDTMTAPVEGLGKVLSGMRDLPKPGAAGGNDIRSMLQSQMVGQGGLSSMKPIESDQDMMAPSMYKPPSGSLDPTQQATGLGHGSGAQLMNESIPVHPGHPNPMSTDPPPPARPSATGDIINAAGAGSAVGRVGNHAGRDWGAEPQNNYQPNVRAPMGGNPHDEEKRRAMMRALGGGF